MHQPMARKTDPYDVVQRLSYKKASSNCQQDDDTPVQTDPPRVNDSHKLGHNSKSLSKQFTV